MRLQEIIAIAKQYQINSSVHSKTGLIHKTQRQEDNFDCFGTVCGTRAPRFSCC